MPTLQLTINDDTRRVTFRCTSPLLYTDPNVIALLAKCDFMQALTPLTLIKFDRVGQTLKWTYEISLVDGRLWTQEINYDSPTDPDPPMTFNVSDEWRRSEFSRQREIRDLLTSMKASHGLEKATIEYLYPV